MKVTKTSILSGLTTTKTISVDERQLTLLAEGYNISDVCPNLNSSDREFLKTGITDEEWEDAMLEEEED